MSHFGSLLDSFSCHSMVFKWYLGWETVRECYDLLDGKSGACFAVLNERFPQLIYGFKYPSSDYWRPNLALVLLLVALAPDFVSETAAPASNFSAVYPFLAFWLIWGGSILTSVSAFIGCVIATRLLSQVF